MRVDGVSEARPGYENEDLLATERDLVVVLDGCGTPDSMAASLRRGCVHGVPWYVRTLAGYLVERAVEPRVALADAVAEAIGAVTDAHRDTCDLANPETPASTVAMLRRRGDVLDYLVLGDSCVLLDRRPLDRRPAGAGPRPPDTAPPDTAPPEKADGGIEVICDERITTALPKPDRYPLGSPERADRDRRASAARAARLNRPGGFWVASTDPAAAGQALTGTAPVADVAAAVVASDGGVRLHEFGELTWPALCDLLATDGPGALVSATRAAEDADPDGARWPRGKRYDDATVAYCHP